MINRCNHRILTVVKIVILLPLSDVVIMAISNEHSLPKRKGKQCPRISLTSQYNPYGVICFLTLSRIPLVANQAGFWPFEIKENLLPFRHPLATVLGCFRMVAILEVPCLFVVVYAPQNQRKKRKLWTDIESIIASHDTISIIMRDFNELRNSADRKGNTFCQAGAAHFNSFIASAGLSDLPLGGRRFTRMNKVGSQLKALNVVMLEAKNKNIYKGIEVGKDKVYMSHLQLANDALIMGEWSLHNAKDLTRIFTCFYLASGLKVNYNKSDAIWCKIICSIYDIKGGFPKSSQHTLKSSPWCQIVKLGNDLTSHGIYLPLIFIIKIGNGQDTRFWLDTWIGNEPLKDSFPRLFRLESTPTAMVFARCPLDAHVHHDTTNSLLRNNTGNSHLLRPLEFGPNGSRNNNFVQPLPRGLTFQWSWYRIPRSPSELQELNGLVELVTHLHVTNDSDKWTCFVSDSKDFSIKAMRIHISKTPSETYLTKRFLLFAYDLKDTTWSRVKDLGQKTLFVGHSLAFWVEDPTWVIKSNCIYFTDDVDFLYAGSRHGGGGDMRIYHLSNGTIEPHFTVESRSFLTPIWLESM
nr:cytochrome P450 [Tanacetum cinerariifolium]